MLIHVGDTHTTTYYFQNNDVGCKACQQSEPQRPLLPVMSSHPVAYYFSSLSLIVSHSETQTHAQVALSNVSPS